MSVTGTGNAWLRRYHQAPADAPTIVLLPHAGGSANYFYGLSELLAHAADVASVQYGGRPQRAGRRRPRSPRRVGGLAGRATPVRRIPRRRPGSVLGTGVRGGGRRFLDGRAERADLEAAHAAAVAQDSRVVAEIAADPLFREALTWQNPGAAARIAMEAPAGQSAWLRRNRSKAKDNLITRYWQRYCAKNDTIGFFGPTTWVSLDPEAPAVRAHHGDRLVRARTVYFEYWALEAFASHLAADPQIRPWLPVGPWPHVTVDGRQVLMPGRDPLPLTEAEANLLARCDGRTSAAAVVGGPEHASALTLLDGLAAQGVIWWGVNMPQNPSAEEALRATVTAIADQAARERALMWLARLNTARDAVSAAGRDRRASAVLVLACCH